MMALQAYNLDSLEDQEFDVSQHQLADLAGNALLAAFQYTASWDYQLR